MFNGFGSVQTQLLAKFSNLTFGSSSFNSQPAIDTKADVNTKAGVSLSSTSFNTTPKVNVNVYVKKMKVKLKRKQI